LGTFISDIVPGAGQEMLVTSTRVIGTNAAATLSIQRTISLNGAADAVWVSLASAVNNQAGVPQSTTNSTTSTAVSDSSDLQTRLISGTQTLNITAGASAANTDVYRVIVVVRLKHKGQLP